MLFFEGKLQYIGSSGNLNDRIRTTLLSGDRESHTLINKMCELKKWDVKETLKFLKSSSNIKFIVTETEDDAKILEDVLIAIHHPFYNIPLRKLRKQT
jgi:excinuclease UvrABC nuclease subunit